MRTRQQRQVRPTRVPARAAAALWGTLLLGALGSGCADGVQWRSYSYEPAIQQSRVDRKLTFVYFRNWFSVTCTDFEEQVLKDPAVLAALRELNAVPLEYGGADQKLGERIGVMRTPGFAILDPDEDVLVVRSGPLSAEETVAAIEDAKQKWAARQSR